VEAEARAARSRDGQVAHDQQEVADGGLASSGKSGLGIGLWQRQSSGDAHHGHESERAEDGGLGRRGESRAHTRDARPGGTEAGDAGGVFLASWQ
jgi:hypothetical protein